MRVNESSGEKQEKRKYLGQFLENRLVTPHFKATSGCNDTIGQ